MRNKEMADLEARLRQLHAADRNAMDIYRDLAKTAPAGEIADTLRLLTEEEGRHMALDREMLKIVESYSREEAP